MFSLYEWVSVCLLASVFAFLHFCMSLKFHVYFIFLSYLFIMIKGYQNIMYMASWNSRESVSAHSEGTLLIKSHEICIMQSHWIRHALINVPEMKHSHKLCSNFNMRALWVVKNIKRSRQAPQVACLTWPSHIFCPVHQNELKKHYKRQEKCSIYILNWVKSISQLRCKH